MTNLEKDFNALSRKTASRFRPGQPLWACAFLYTDGSQGTVMCKEPVRGMLMQYDTDTPMNPGSKANFFIPENPHGTGYDFANAVAVDARCYAETLSKATVLYEELIQDTIRWHVKTFGGRI